MFRFAVLSPSILISLAFNCALPTRVVVAQEFSRSAVQTVYRQGTPHTNKTGAIRLDYDPATSFFPIADWGTPLEGTTYGYSVDWNELKSAGYNTAWTWFKPAVQSLHNGWINDMQVVLMGQHANIELQQVRDIATYRNRLLGIMWKDEPTTGVPLDQMQATYESFQGYRQTVHSYLPNVPVFVDDAPAFNNGPAQAAWWKTWATGGDLTAQDNYPIYPWTTSIGLSSPGGISESISRAAYAVNQQKPVWAIIQAFESNDPETATFPWRFPTPTQMRAQVYSAIVHGATGITYFAWDTYISRQPNLIGISPNPQPNGYVTPGPGVPFQGTATPEQIQKSKALWNAVAGINQELTELSSAILSPTVDEADLLYVPQISNRSAPNDTSKYSSTPIRTLLKREPDGRYVLFAVNLDDRSMDVEFEFSRTLQKFSLLYEGDGGFFEQLGAANQFSYHFGPYDTHIFAISDAPAVPIPGDFDGNRIVNGDDLTQWSGDFGINDDSDGDGDFDTDGADFLVWQRNLGSGSLATAVPEPSVLGIGTIVLIVVTRLHVRSAAFRR